jgi:hypothetical protein
MEPGDTTGISSPVGALKIIGKYRLEEEIAEGTHPRKHNAHSTALLTR